MAAVTLPRADFMLATRIVTAVVLIMAVLAALLLLPPFAWAVVTLAAIAAASYEWSNLVGLHGARAALFVGATVIAGLALLLGGDFDRGWSERTVLYMCGIATLFWLVAAPLWLARRLPSSRVLGRAIAGWIVLLGAWVAVVELQARSPWLALAAMAIVWIADTAAYFCGRAFGKHKLSPQVSPGKSWEGVYGGLAGVGVYAIAISPLAPRAGYTGAVTPVAIFVFVVCVLALAAISVVGDLTESLLKRNAGVKDSGALLPGHGGVLDRIDALLAAMPPAALLATLLLK